MPRQAGDDLLRRAVRQGAEDEFESAPVDRVDRDQIGQSGPGKMRKDRAYRLSCLAVGGQDGDLGHRMAQEQADEFGTGIAACAPYADPMPLCRRRGRIRLAALPAVLSLAQLPPAEKGFGAARQIGDFRSAISCAKLRTAFFERE